MEVSKSKLFSCDPISIWDFGTNENCLTLPTCSISLLDFSSLPIGTSSNTKFGKICSKSSNFFLAIICSSVIFEISLDIFLTLHS